VEVLLQHPGLPAFVAWVKSKPEDFFVRTHKSTRIRKASRIAADHHAAIEYGQNFFDPTRACRSELSIHASAKASGLAGAAGRGWAGWSAAQECCRIASTWIFPLPTSAPARDAVPATNGTVVHDAAGAALEFSLEIAPSHRAPQQRACCKRLRRPSGTGAGGASSGATGVRRPAARRG